jgi:hypothetical protein
VNDAVVAPDATLTLAGTEIAGFPDDKLTTMPPVGAVTFNVILPAAVFPLTTELLRVTDETDNGATVILADFEAPPSDAVMVTEVEALGVPATIWKEPLLEPAGIFNVDGTDAALELDVRVTVAPDAGAGAVRLILPVPVRSLMINVGDSERVLTWTELTVIFTVLLTPE